MNVRLFRVSAAFLLLMSGVACWAADSAFDTALSTSSDDEGSHGASSTTSESVFSLGGKTVEIGSFSINEKKGEDAHVFAGMSDSSESAGQIYAAIFDGHGGKQVAQAAAGEGGIIDMIYDESGKLQDGETFANAIEKAFIRFDESVKAVKAVGATATVVFAFGDELYIAHVGDSRCVVKPVIGKFFSTPDHTPTNIAERERIEKAKGVTFEWPIDSGSGVYRLQAGGGHLGVSRSLGDYLPGKIKPDGLSAMPDVTVKSVQESDFVILASDGLWDNVSSEDAVAYVAASKGKVSADQVAQDLLESSRKRDLAAGKSGAHDDMTVIVIRFNSQAVVAAGDVAQ